MVSGITTAGNVMGMINTDLLDDVRAGRFDAMDTNGDGKLDSGELESSAGQRFLQTGSAEITDEFIASTDINEDGTVDKEEYLESEATGVGNFKNSILKSLLDSFVKMFNWNGGDEDDDKSSINMLDILGMAGAGEITPEVEQQDTNGDGVADELDGSNGIDSGASGRLLDLIG